MTTTTKKRSRKKTQSKKASSKKASSKKTQPKKAAAKKERDDKKAAAAMAKRVEKFTAKRNRPAKAKEQPAGAGKKARTTAPDPTGAVRPKVEDIENKKKGSTKKSLVNECYNNAETKDTILSNIK